MEFAYNRVVHSTTDMFSFEVIYGFNHLFSLDLLHLSNIDYMINRGSCQN